MAEEPVTTEIKNPNWENIEFMFDEIDSILDKAVNEKNTNFIEIDIALLMVNEKIKQQKYYVYSQLGKGEEGKPVKIPDFYG